MTISVRPSPRSVSTTITTSDVSTPGWSVTVNTSRSGSTTSTYLPSQLISRRLGPKNIVARHSPPGRASIVTVESGMSAWRPPYQSAKRSGSVHSLHTTSRGASNTRVILMPGSVIALAETRLELLDARVPEDTVLVEPFGRFLEGRPLDPGRPQLGIARASN